MNLMNRSDLNLALETANKGYIARKGASAVLNKRGYQNDIGTALALVAGFDDAVIEGIATLCNDAGIDLLPQLADVSNVKVSKRLVAGLGFIKTRDMTLVQGSVRTMFHEVSAMVQGATNRESLAFAATGTKGEGASDVTLKDSGAVARKLRQIAGKTKVSSEQTQNSVTFSAKGICAILGIAKKDTRKSFPVLNRDSVILRALLDTINGISEGAIALHVDNDDNKKGGKRK